MTLPLKDSLSVFQQAIETVLWESGNIAPGGALPMDPNHPTGTLIEVAGVIGLNSPECKGSLSLQFPRETILNLISLTQGSESPEKWAESFTTQVLKKAEPQFRAIGLPIQFALPNILSGKSLEALGGHNARSRQGLEFRLKEGLFQVLLEADPRNPSPSGPGIPTLDSPKNWTAEALLEFVKAVRKTLEVQFSTRIEIGAPFKKSENAFTFDVGSMIGVSDGDFSGYFGMYYQKSAFLGLMSNLLGDEFTELSEDIQDGASEITNICFGVAKQVLNDQGHSIQMALPYLIRGTGISSAASSSLRTAIAVPLSTPHGKFWIEFGYKEG